MRARTWFLLRAIAVVIALAAAALYVLRWPSGWSSVRLEMSRPAVTALVGAPANGERRISGLFWVEQRPLVRYELWIGFDDADRVDAYTIERRLGTAQSFYQQRLKGDLNLRYRRSRR